MFQARIDLPDAPGELPAIVETMARAARRDRGGRLGTAALVVVYTEDQCLAEETAELLSASLERAGFEVLMCIRADGARWFPVGTGHAGDAVGRPYDVRSHALTSRSVYDGKVTFRSREELADSLAPVDPDLVEEVQAAHAALPPLAGGDRELLTREGQWLLALIRAAVAEGSVPVPEDIARMARAVAHPDVRDLTWCHADRQEAARHADLWRAVVQRCPQEIVASPAGVLAFMAWLSGDGALAWCAIDRSLSADPDHTLARLVADALQSATPPTSWRPVDRSVLALDAG